MNINLKKAIKYELHTGTSYLKKNDTKKAFHHFERAHILGQSSPWYHTLAHLKMLYIALIRRDISEVLGQLIRIPAGFIGSMIGIVPVGNTGGSNVSPFESMKIPDDLQDIINSSKEF